MQGFLHHIPIRSRDALCGLGLKGIHVVLIFSVLLSPLPAFGDCCEECGEEIEEFIPNYEELEEFEDLYRGFEEEIDRFEEDEVFDSPQSFQMGVLKKWNRKAKRWLKKKTFKMLRKMMRIKKHGTIDDYAYTLAGFKRKTEKRFRAKRGLDKAFKLMDQNCPDDIQDFTTHFKNRIQFFYYNKHLRPKSVDKKQKSQHSFESRKYGEVPEASDEELDEFFSHMSLTQVLGCVAIGCGVMISVIPNPLTRWAGSAMISIGMGFFAEEYRNKIVEVDEANRQRKMNEGQPATN